MNKLSGKNMSNVFDMYVRKQKIILAIKLFYSCTYVGNKIGIESWIECFYVRTIYKIKMKKQKEFVSVQRML